MPGRLSGERRPSNRGPCVPWPTIIVAHEHADQALPWWRDGSGGTSDGRHRLLARNAAYARRNYAPWTARELERSIHFDPAAVERRTAIGGAFQPGLRHRRQDAALPQTAAMAALQHSDPVFRILRLNADFRARGQAVNLHT